MKGLYIVVVGGTHILLAGNLKEQTRRLRLWGQRVFSFMKIPITVEGAEHLEGLGSVLFTSNHASTLDIPLLFAAIPRDFRMVAKAELLRVPFIGWVIRRCNFVPIQRQRHSKAVKALDGVREMLDRGIDFYLAAEGTRSWDGKLLPFKKGPFVIALQQKIPLVPVTLFNTHRVMPKKSLLPRSGIELKVRIHPPIHTRDMEYDDRDVLRDRVRKIIEQDLLSEIEAGS